MSWFFLIYLIGMIHSIVSDFDEMQSELPMGFIGWAYIFFAGITWPIWRLTFSINVLNRHRKKNNEIL